MYILCLFQALDCSFLDSFSCLVNEGREEDHYTVTVLHIIWPLKGKLIVFFLLFEYICFIYRRVVVLGSQRSSDTFSQ